MLNEQAWSIKDLLYGFWGEFFSAGRGGWFRAELYLARSGSQSQRRI